MKQYDELKVFTDGGARGNPGPAGAGVVIKTTNDEVIEAFGKYLGDTTNNVAEYTALELGLKAAQNYQPKRLEVYLDSELVVKQMNGEYKVKNPQLKIIKDQILELTNDFKISYQHIYRKENQLADQEVNQAIDKALGLKK